MLEALAHQVLARYPRSISELIMRARWRISLFPWDARLNTLAFPDAMHFPLYSVLCSSLPEAGRRPYVSTRTSFVPPSPAAKHLLQFGRDISHEPCALTRSMPHCTLLCDLADLGLGIQSPTHPNP